MPAQPISVSKLRLYPKSKPADQNIQDDLFALWKSGRRFIVLSGAPGVGKTRAAEDFVIKLLEGHAATHDKAMCRLTDLFPDFRVKTYESVEIEANLKAQAIKFVWDICVMHPQYTYEDLIRGYRANTSDAGHLQLQVREGQLGFMSRVCDALLKIHGKTEYPCGVLILDEINRAPIGQLLGEAMYALDRRDEPVSTPYELKNIGSRMAIPDSLLLIGTMNSVDRAVAGFDFALRRRFVILTVASKRETIESYYDRKAVKVKTIALKLYDSLQKLIQESQVKGVVPLSELVMGHSYFLVPTTLNEDEAIRWLAESYQFQILPVLLDYDEQGLISYKDDALQGVLLPDVVNKSKPLSELKTEEVIEQLKSLNVP